MISFFKCPQSKLRWPIAASVFFAALSAPALAQDQDTLHPQLSSKVWLDVGAYYPDYSFSARIDGVLGGIGDEIDLNANLDLADRNALLTAELGWQFGEKWAISVQYFKANRSRQRTLDTTIPWGDHSFEIGADVVGGTEASITRVFFSRKFFNQGRHDLRLGAGFHRIQLAASLEGNARLNDDSIEFSSRRVGTQAPLPNLGAWYRYSPSEKWVFSARTDWLAASVGDIKGRILNLVGGVNYSVFENFGVGLNYQYFRLDADITDNNWHGYASITYQGPVIYLSGYWR